MEYYIGGQNPVYPFREFGLIHSNREEHCNYCERNFNALVNSLLIEIIEKKNETHTVFKNKKDLLLQICAAFPTNQCTQLKRDLRGAPGWGLAAAINGWIKTKIVVANPKDACIVSELHSPSSTNIITKAAIVIDHVNIMKNLCHLSRQKKEQNTLLIINI